MWKGRVGRSARRSDCCDDGPLSSLILRLNGCFDTLNASLRSSSQVEGAWGGCWDPSLGF